jgi:hypothetical protein
MHSLTAVVKNNTDPPKVQEDGFMHPELAKDKLVLSWIKTTSFSSIKTLLIPCTTAHQAWTMLAKRFSPLASTRVRILQDQIRTLRKDNNTTVVDYFNYAKSLFDSLTQFGATMDDDYLNYILYCDLLTLDCLVWMVIPYLIPLPIEAWWVASNILLYRGLIFHLLLIKCVSSCTTLVLPIFRLSSAFFGILRVQLSKVLCFTSPMTLLYAVSLMLIGLTL